ncbi:hypothetical protein T459_19662 [Capsicum annuum]|uniref:Protein kinase domain-containing protein n=1 Tax=Capsicum annuum TaxID=4072 RepID=A0A2G2Z294_CAPAN|nr:hypothetical protein T459_19662 [Capsicum annuum]
MIRVRRGGCPLLELHLEGLSMLASLLQQVGHSCNAPWTQPWTLLIILGCGHSLGAGAAHLRRKWPAPWSLNGRLLMVCLKHGVIHRDLKPENFLYDNATENAQLKAIGFGLSILFEPVASVSFSSTMGTGSEASSFGSAFRTSASLAFCCSLASKWVGSLANFGISLLVTSNAGISSYFLTSSTVGGSIFLSAIFSFDFAGVASMLSSAYGISSSLVVAGEGAGGSSTFFTSSVIGVNASLATGFSSSMLFFTSYIIVARGSLIVGIFSSSAFFMSSTIVGAGSSALGFTSSSAFCTFSTLQQLLIHAALREYDYMAPVQLNSKHKIPL